MANFLSDYNQATINGVQAKLVLSNEILANYGQKEIETDGQGVTQRFITDTNAARINIVRQKMLVQKARALGADYNGQAFPTTEEEISTEQYGIDLIFVMDMPIPLRNATQDMIPVDLIGGATKSFATLFARNINAVTVAGKIAKSIGTAAQRVEINLADTAVDFIRSAILSANTKLDEGDVAHGIDYFPLEDRVGVIRTSLRPYLYKAANVLLGGSNFAQEMLSKGVIDPTSQQKVLDRGYIGMIDGISIFQASPIVWTLAEAYLGLLAGELDNVYGYVSSGYANVRGIALSNTIKIVDAVKAQGIIIQPDCRFGFASLYAKGNVMLVKSSYVLPSVFSTTGVTVAPLPDGSRSLPTAALSAQSGTSAPSVTVAVSTSRSFGGGYWFYDTTASYATVAAADTAYAAVASTKKAALSAVGATTLTPTATVTASYAHVVFYDDIGNCVIQNSTGAFTVTI